MRLVGDGRLGYPDEAPYNAIHVGAAADTLPQEVSTCNPVETRLRIMSRELTLNTMLLITSTSRVKAPDFSSKLRYIMTLRGKNRRNYFLLREKLDLFTATVQ